MIKSMTGFGRTFALSSFGKFSVEIRSVNSRFLDIVLKLPESLATLEDRVRQLVKNKIKRGRVNLNVSFERKGQAIQQAIFDEELARRYAGLLKHLNHSLGLKGDIRLEDIINLPNVISFQQEAISPGTFWPSLSKTVRTALNKLDKMRTLEGGHLLKDILRHTKKISINLAIIEKRIPQVLNRYRTRLLKQLEQFTGQASIDKSRIEMEIALFAKNADIQEEIVRMKSHLKALRDACKEEEPGKKLDFITQEMQRETNTMGQKAQDYEISRMSIEIKGGIEKIREQLQNVE